ncbi:MAG TPA: transaldolase [Steroidobacteraceae bacterium]
MNSNPTAPAAAPMPAAGPVPAAGPNPLLGLRKLGQSVWLDDMGRAILADGSLARLIQQDGLGGVTSNPSIFAASMTKDPQYLQAIQERLRTVTSSLALYESLAIEDLRAAADLFAPLYQSTSRGDGFVSLEVSPHIAYDSAASIAEGKRLWGQLQRPNAMIKIPGTEPGLTAIRELIAEGINVNITLLFSPERYHEVANAFMEGLESRVAAGKPIDHVSSVASFFLSRIDTLVDQKLDTLAAKGQPAAKTLRGKAALANAARAYEIYTNIIASERWEKLAARGVRPQRLLWASTSAKDPAYSPIKYVEDLVAADTVNTMPHQTIDAYRRLGQPEPRLERHMADAADAREGLGRLGVDLDEVAETLEREGVRKFVEPFDKLQAWLEEKRTQR